MKKQNVFLSLVTAALLVAPLQPSAFPASSTSDGDDGPPTLNVLLILLDDLGIDHYSGYGLVRGDRLPYAPTPRIDELRDGSVDGDPGGASDHGGLLLRHMYTNPTCSPTRAALVTGRYGFRTGFGGNPAGKDINLPDEEVPMPELYGAAGIRCGMFGKWHLTGQGYDTADADPVDQGFDFFAGHEFNNQHSASGDDIGYPNHCHWDMTTDDGTGAPVSTPKHRWDARIITNEAVEWIGEQVGNDDTFFAYVCYNPPHHPWQVPQRLATLSAATIARLETLGFGPCGGVADGTGDLETRRRVVFQAMVESVDVEVGRLVSSVRALDENTMIFVIGDNGSPRGMPSLVLNGASVDRGNQRKTRVYELGTRVPVVAYGPLIPVGSHENSDMFHIVDVWRTVAEIFGISTAAIDAALGVLTSDSVSFKHVLEDPTMDGLRDYGYTERIKIGTPSETEISPAIERAITRIYDVGDDPFISGRYKLIRLRTAGFEFVDYLFNLDTDEWEETNLNDGSMTADETTAFTDLKAAMDAFYVDIEAPVLPAE